MKCLPSKKECTAEPEWCCHGMRLEDFAWLAKYNKIWPTCMLLMMKELGHVMLQKLIVYLGTWLLHWVHIYAATSLALRI